MLISKNIQIEFADSTIKAIDAVYDIREGVRSASLNLYSRYGVQIQTPMVYGDDKVVVGIILLGLVCGVGTVAMTQLLQVPTAELDHLYCCGT